MEISNRLKMIANQIESSRCLADIGTDHGYLPVYLLRTGRIKKAVACDINKDPLAKAAENIEKAGLSGSVSLRLCDGLSGLSVNEADTVVISGMGGLLIIDILKSSADVVSSVNRLVLQPQLHIDKVRRYLHKTGFLIENEDMVFEDGKYYTVINAVPGFERYTETEYFLGKRLIETKNPVLKKYIEFKIGKNEAIVERLKLASSQIKNKRMSEIEYENKMLKEVISCL